MTDKRLRSDTPRDTHLSIRVTTPLRERLHAQAQRERQSVSTTVERLLLQALDAPGAEEPPPTIEDLL